MTLRRQDVERLLEPEPGEGVAALSISELRKRRDECLRAEVVISYLRRVLQGELDLLRAEASMRESGARGDLGRLVEELPEILTHGQGAGSGRKSEAGDGAAHSGRASSSASSPAHISLVTMPNIGDAWSEEAAEELDDLIATALSSELVESGLPGGALPGANLHTFSDDELAAVAERLEENETVLSDTRRRLHRRIDALQAAIVERYKSGSASPDSLLD